VRSILKEQNRQFPSPLILVVFSCPCTQILPAHVSTLNLY